NGGDVRGLAGLVAQHGAQLGHAEVEPGVEVDVALRAPDRPPQVLARDERPRARQQLPQDREGLGGELDRRAVAPQLAVLDIQLEGAEAIPGTRRGHGGAWMIPEARAREVTLRVSSAHPSFANASRGATGVASRCRGGSM